MVNFVLCIFVCVLDCDFEVEIDGVWIVVKLVKVLVYCDCLFVDLFYCLIYVEVDGLLGVIIDCFGDVVVI